MELGGVSPFIALPDVPPEEIAAALVRAMSLTTTAGQSCQAASRLLVHADVIDETLDIVAEKLQSLWLGVAYDQATEVGPLVSAVQRDRVLAWVTAASQDGAVLYRSAPDRRASARVLCPARLRWSVSARSKTWRTESFGPVVAVTSWEDDDEVVALANCAQAGLTATVWGGDFARALKLARRVGASYVWVNDIADHVLGMPFGGLADSGTGREEALETLQSYVQSRSLVTRFPLKVGEYGS